MKTNIKKIFRDGILDNNPVLVQVLGTCPTLATTTSVKNGLGMGLSAMAVLIFSNLFISILRNFIPKQVRIAAYIVIISGFVTAVDLLLQAYLPDLSASLGVFIPLIVVNCIILARAEAFASKNSPLPSLLDGIATGLGFTAALILISSVREILGTGTFLDIQIMPDGFKGATLLVLPAGAFFTFGAMTALFAKIRSNAAKKKNKEVNG